MPSTRAAARAAQQTVTATARSRVFDDPNLFDLILSNLNAKSLARVEQVCTAWRDHDKEGGRVLAGKLNASLRSLGGSGGRMEAFPSPR